MEIELTIKSNYLPEWGLWEGVRELVQNAKDAETEFSASLEVSHGDDKLTLHNEGVTLPVTSLLMGHSTKAEKDLIGQFGEGLKLGILALTRMGRKVSIRTKNERWTPRIGMSPNFKENVLFVDVSETESYVNAVIVEIELLNREWDSFEHKFLWLKEPEKLNTYRGDILLEDKHRGCLFVKGVYVGKEDKYKYGYNFANAKVDRDRKMISAWDRRHETCCMWVDALEKNEDYVDDFFSLLENPSEDLINYDFYMANYSSESSLKNLMRIFSEKYGEESVPVSNLEESREMEHLGRKGVVLPSPMIAMFERAQGTLEDLKKKLANYPVKEYSWHELSDEEKANFSFAEDTVKRGLLAVDSTFKCPVIGVVDFKSESTLGQFNAGRALLAKKILSDKKETLATLIHEVSHSFGKDGSHGHVAFLEKLWTAVVGFYL